jgi:hypothetical protein
VAPSDRPDSRPRRLLAVALLSRALVHFSNELPADRLDAGLAPETADEAFQCQILWSLTEQRRPDLRSARRIYVFAVQCARAEP